MAILEHSSTRVRHILSSSHLVGRSHACSLRSKNPRVSAEHAVFRWTGAAWEVRDLASSNGTFVNENRLECGCSARVEPGARVAFGDPTEVFALIDDAAPVACARAGDGSILYAEDGVLAIPTPDHYQFLIIQGHEAGHWSLELPSGDSRPIENQEIVHHGERAWYLDLPIVMAPTQPTAGTAMHMDDIRLLIEVSADQEDVDITIVHRSGHHRLPARANADLLLALARERLYDAQNPSLPEAEHGWVHRDTLVDELSKFRSSVMTPERLSVEIYRARNQLRAAGVVDAARLIESRHASRRVRLGIGTIEIVAHGRQRRNS
jgi:hypothetical protein